MNYLKKVKRTKNNLIIFNLTFKECEYLNESSR